MFGSGIITNYSPQRYYFPQKDTSSAKPYSPQRRSFYNEKTANSNIISFGRKLVLAIMDGWGNGKKNDPGNAIEQANPKTFNEIIATCPNTNLDAHGKSVGLPEGQLGNSEAGHSNIGGGRIVLQDITRINKSIDNKDFLNNPALQEAMQNAIDNNSSLHLIGLVSTNGAHSSLNHLYALIDMAKQKGINKVYVHAFLDGRDTRYQSGIEFVNQVENKLRKEELPPVASVIGAVYAMDRDNNWDRIEKAYDCLVSGVKNGTDSAAKNIKESYDAGKSDEFILPTVIGDAGSRIHDKDSIICFNYRADRAREITDALTKSNEDFLGFNRKTIPQYLCYVCMTQYNEKNTLPVAFPPLESKNFLSEVISKAGKKQHKVAETEKYAHVTFFLNGGIEQAYKEETRTLVPSIKVKSYENNPGMRAEEVTQETIKALKDNDVVVVNYANTDMVGHTGKLQPTIQAVNVVDNCLKKLVKAAKDEDATIVLTADHGNAECMIDPETGNPFTTHTDNPVPFAIINAKNQNLKLKESGSLIDIAPTVLDLLDIPKPEEMIGQSLILK